MRGKLGSWVAVQRMENVSCTGVIDDNENVLSQICEANFRHGACACLLCGQVRPHRKHAARRQDKWPRQGLFAWCDKKAIMRRNPYLGGMAPCLHLANSKVRRLLVSLSAPASPELIATESADEPSVAQIILSDTGGWN